MSALDQSTTAASAHGAGQDGLDLMLELARHARLIVGGGLLAGVLAVGITFLVKPTFTAATVVLPPQGQQSAASAALSSLGALAGLAGGAGGVRNQLDQHVSLLLSTNVADRMIERFKLNEVYDQEFKQDARKQFWINLRVVAGRRDGLITIEVDDRDPKRAAEMAAAMVDEFRRVTTEIAVTDAQQRRVFFEKHMQQARDKLTLAQRDLQSSGFAAEALKAEPKAAAESFAKLKAEATAAQVRLQGLLGNLTPDAPEVQQQQALLRALNAQVQKAEANSGAGSDSDYVGRYREFKYQETLFELFSRQFELARVDESREGGLIQVVDAAQVPEKKTKPKRAIVGVVTSLGAGLALVAFVLLRSRWRTSASPEARAKLARLWPALWGRA